MQKKGRADGIRLVQVCGGRLEAELQGKLHDARVVRSGRAQEIVAAQRVLNTASAGDRASDPLRVVEDVESFCAELKIKPLVQLEVLVQRHVEVPTSGIIQHVASGAPLGEASGLGKGIRIEEKRPLDAGIRGKNRPRDLVRISDQIREAAGAVAVPQPGAVREDSIHDGEWRSALRHEDSRVLPAAKSALFPTCDIEEGKIVYPTGGQYVSLVEVGAGVVAMRIVRIGEVRIEAIRKIVERVAPGVGNAEAEATLRTSG